MMPTISQQEQQQDSTIGGSHVSKNKDKDRIISIFKEAGLILSPQEIEELPTWQDIQQIVGHRAKANNTNLEDDNKDNGPLIYNLQSCTSYRSLIPPVERNIGCSGMFNSGTNLVTKLLKANCVIPERVEKYGTARPFFDNQGKPIGPGEAHGIRWQVPWGKHMPANYRDEHAAKYAKAIWKESVLAVVTIRHPYPWFASMCKNDYTARWSHGKNKCPHLRNDDHGGALVPVDVTYDGQVTHHDSLAHLWNDWYAHYLREANFPYLVVRFEDLQFYAKNVTYQICTCAGGVIRSDRPFQYIVDSAKEGPGHGKKEERTGMLAAWKKYGKPMPPQNGFSIVDYNAAVEYLDSEFMSMFGYQHPDPIV